MSRIQSFPPIVSQRSKLLILGSMPGEASLKAGQYYAHPRNAFWHIMGELFGAGPSLPYQERVAILQSVRIALWDSLQACIRPGSLDASIKERGGQRLSSSLRQVSEHYSCVLQRHKSGEVICPLRQACVIRRPPRLRAPAIDQPCPCRDATGVQSAGMVRREEDSVLTIQELRCHIRNYRQRGSKAFGEIRQQRPRRSGPS
jgi:hypoxanthine-DNA glycosylase